MPGSLQNFMAELTRRKVLRVVAAYAIGTFGALQSADVIVSALNLPHVLMTGLVVLIFAGLPVTAALAWVFDLTPEGVVRTAPLAASADAAGTASAVTAPAPARGSRLGLALGVAAISLGLAGALLWWQARHKAPLANDLIAVMPFTVGGGEQYRYLHDGLAELLSAGISGGGALRTVDQRALDRQIREAGSEPDNETGGALARRFGAGMFILGNVLEVKDRLRLHAQLFDASDPERPLADASAEGDAAKLFSLVDDLLRQLRPNLVGGGKTGMQDPIVAMAEHATTSLPALKAFIDGENLLRDGDIKASFSALQRAVAEDPNFALAQYRLAVVASWSDEFPLGRAALLHALHDREKLPERERELIEAFSAYWRGNAKDAEARYRKILEKSPDDAESWYQLGEVLFHDGPLQGRSPLEAKPAFAKAAALEPQQRLYSLHLDQIARMEGDRAGIARGDEQKLRAVPDETALGWERDWALGDTAKADADAAKLNPKNLIEAAALSLAHTPDPDGVAAARGFVARALTTPGISVEDKRQAQLWSSQIDLSVGQRKKANQVVVDALADDPSLDYLLVLRALMPFLPHDKAELQTALLRIERAEPAVARKVTEPAKLRYLREYLEGRVKAQLGDVSGAEQAATALAGIQDSDGSALGQDLALAVRAHLASIQGKPAEALELLSKMSGGTPVDSIGSSASEGSGERWLRAELLEQAGKPEEALRWINSVEAMGPTPWSPALRARRAQLLEKLGQKKQAMEQWRLFASLWKDADADLQPAVTNARARLDALAREP